MGDKDTAIQSFRCLVLVDTDEPGERTLILLGGRDAGHVMRKCSGKSCSLNMHPAIIAARAEDHRRLVEIRPRHVGGK